MRVLIAIGAILVSHAALAAQDPPVFLGTIGSAGSGPAQFVHVTGIGLDNAGNIYVADELGHKVLKYDANGNIIATWGSVGTGPGQFEGPRDVAVDPSGTVYVSDYTRVEVFTPSLTFVREWSFSNGIQYLSLSSDDNYIYTAVDKYIRVFTIDGVFVRDVEYQSHAISNGSLGFGTGTSGDIYIAEPGASLVHKYGPLADPLIITWGDGLIISAGAVGVDPLENVYVGDLYGIREFDALGNPLTMWGSHGSGPGQFNTTAIDIAADQFGDIYAVADNRIQKFANRATPVKHGSWGTLKAIYRDIRRDP